MLAKMWENSVRQDIWDVFEYLAKTGITIRLNDQQGLKNTIYDFYHSHGKAPTQILTLFKQELANVHQQLRRRTEILFVETPEWFRYYTFQPSDRRAMDSCICRIYLNPQPGHFKIISDIAGLYFSQPASRRKPMHFKFINPGHAATRHIRRADKIVIYASMEGDFIPSMVQLVRAYPKEYFYEEVPKFTSKIRNGVGRATEPAKGGKFRELVRSLSGSREAEFSYGQYVSYLIAVAIKVIAVNEKIFQNENEFISFHTLPEQSIRKLYTGVSDFVVNRLNKDLAV